MLVGAWWSVGDDAEVRVFTSSGYLRLIYTAITSQSVTVNERDESTRVLMMLSKIFQKLNENKEKRGEKRIASGSTRSECRPRVDIDKWNEDRVAE